MCAYDFERYTDERVHMLKVCAMGQLLIIVFFLVVLIKAPMFDIYCVRVSGYSMEALFHSGSEYLMKKSGYTLERGDVVTLWGDNVPAEGITGKVLCQISPYFRLVKRPDYNI